MSKKKFLEVFKDTFPNNPEKQLEQQAKFMAANCKKYAEKREIDPDEFETNVLSFIEQNKSFGMGVLNQVANEMTVEKMFDRVEEDTNPKNLNKPELIDYIKNEHSEQDIVNVLKSYNVKDLDNLTVKELKEHFIN